VTPQAKFTGSGISHMKIEKGVSAIIQTHWGVGQCVCVQVYSTNNLAKAMV